MQQEAIKEMYLEDTGEQTYAILLSKERIY